MRSSMNRVKLMMMMWFYGSIRFGSIWMLLDS